MFPSIRKDMHFLALDTRGIISVFTDLQTPVTFTSGNKVSTYILPSFDANACHLEVDTTLYKAVAAVISAG